MARDPMRNRVIRMPDALWEAARKKADERGDVLAEVIRQAIERYVKR